MEEFKRQQKKNKDLESTESTSLSLKFGQENEGEFEVDWSTIDPNTALGYLLPKSSNNVTMSNKAIRYHAVSIINKLSNRALADLMPQLVQALKSEPFHSSYLSEVLLSRSLASPRVVGHAYFWAINASLYDKHSFERLYLHYERFLFLCTDYRKELYSQFKMNDIIVDTSSKSLRSEGINRDELCVLLLEELNHNISLLKKQMELDYFTLPHIPDIPFQKISELNILSSKQEVIILNWVTHQDYSSDDKTEVKKVLYK